MTNRQFVKLDRYALFDAGRAEHLTATEFVVLFALVMLSDFRSAEWTGTLYELAEHTPSGRTTVRQAVDRLTSIGLITQVRPFRQHSEATIRVDCFDGMVIPNERRGPRRVPAIQTPIAPEPTQKRAVSAPSESFQQDFHSKGRDRGEGEVGQEDDESNGRAPICPDCRRPMSGAPFGEGCQCPF